MPLLAATPPAKLTDAKGRPYFLWDLDMTIDEFRARLGDADPDARAYFTGKLMRQAKPDDVFTFVTAQRIADEWSRIERYLGKTRPFWGWLLERWRAMGHVRK